MAPSVDCSAMSLLCCEEVSGCLSEDEEEEEEELRRRRCNPLPSFNAIADDELGDIDTAVSALVEREIFHIPNSDYPQNYQNKVLDADSRQDAVLWLYKVQSFYNFSNLTAFLSVNYFDRFLSLYPLPKGKTWMIQLLSVACLSIAAKMEETEVPLLLDLQVAPSCLFEPRTIQRMELLVLSTLQWRVSSVTPFSYIDYFLQKLGLTKSPHQLMISSRINELFLYTAKELKFAHYRPSSVATAAVLSTIQSIIPAQFAESKRILLSLLPSELQESCLRCMKLMVGKFLPPLPKTGESYGNSVPQSPIGVLDASFSSSDSESTFKSIASDPCVQVSSPAPKKRKVDDFCSSVNLSTSQ